MLQVLKSNWNLGVKLEAGEGSRGFGRIGEE